METFQDRLTHYIEKHLNTTKYAFAKSIGYSPSRLYATLEPKRKPSGDLMARVAKHYPDLNRDWLLTGEGKMIKTANHAKQKQMVNAENKTPETPIFIMEQEKIEPTPGGYGFADLTECVTKFQAMQKAYYEQLSQNNKLLQDNSQLKDKLIDMLTKGG